MTLRFRCRGRCQDRVERTGKWEQVGDVVSPRLNAMLVVCVAERRWAVSVTCFVRSLLGQRTRWRRQLSEQDAMW